MPSLIQLSRAKFEGAKRLFALHTLCQLLLLLWGLFGTWEVSAKQGMLLALAALITECAAWILNYLGKRSYSLADEAKMAALQVDALGKALPSFELTDLTKRLGQRTVMLAEHQDDQHYYSSCEKPGLARLRDHLQESSFWSTELFRIAAWCALGKFVLIVVVVLVLAVSMLPLLVQEQSLAFSRILITILMSVVAFDYLGRASDWFAASRQTHEIDRNLEGANFSSAEDALPAFADYAVATASVRPIPSLIYKWRKPFLDRLWAQRKSYNS